MFFVGSPCAPAGAANRPNATVTARRIRAGMSDEDADVIHRDEPGPGQESVWDFPRPPRIDRVPHRLRVLHGSTVVADTVAGFRVVETSHPPSYYLPPGDCDLSLLEHAPGASFCEWKGHATYWDVTVDGDTMPRTAWSYPDPSPRFTAIRDFLSFYPSPLACFVDDERATAQPGG